MRLRSTTKCRPVTGLAYGLEPCSLRYQTSAQPSRPAAVRLGHEVRAVGPRVDEHRSRSVMPRAGERRDRRAGRCAAPRRTRGTRRRSCSAARRAGAPTPATRSSVERRRAPCRPAPSSRFQQTTLRLARDRRRRARSRARASLAGSRSSIEAKRQRVADALVAAQDGGGLRGSRRPSAGRADGGSRAPMLCDGGPRRNRRGREVGRRVRVRARCARAGRASSRGGPRAGRRRRRRARPAGAARRCSCWTASRCRRR